MKKLLLISILVGLITAPAWALPTWVSDPSTAHFFFGFSDGYVTDEGGGVYRAIPEDDDAEPFDYVIDPLAWCHVYEEGHLKAGWNSTDGYLYGHHIVIDSGLWLPNEDVQNPIKDIWVRIHYKGTKEYTDADVTPHYRDGWNVTDSEVTGGLPGDNVDEGGNWHLLTLEWQIRPNPYKEEFYFYFEDSGAKLDSIDIYTRCIPEPATVCLLGLGMLALLRKRRV